MGTSCFSDGFKHNALHQTTVRGYQVRELSRRLDVGAFSPTSG